MSSVPGYWEPNIYAQVPKGRGTPHSFSAHRWQSHGDLLPTDGCNISATPSYLEHLRPTRQSKAISRLHSWKGIQFQWRNDCLSPKFLIKNSTSSLQCWLEATARLSASFLSHDQWLLFSQWLPISPLLCVSLPPGLLQERPSSLFVILSPHLSPL